jgi:rubrerythrin
VSQRLQEMAQEERKHRAKLEDVLTGNVRWAIRRSKAEPVTDLRLSDHLISGTLDPNADYQDVLLFAAHREKTAHEFYKAMAEMVEDKLTQNLFEMLATEELRHKYVLEKTYEEVVYKDF